MDIDRIREFVANNKAISDFDVSHLLQFSTAYFPLDEGLIDGLIDLDKSPFNTQLLYFVHQAINNPASLAKEDSLGQALTSRGQLHESDLAVMGHQTLI